MVMVSCAGLDGSMVGNHEVSAHAPLKDLQCVVCESLGIQGDRRVHADGKPYSCEQFEQRQLPEEAWESAQEAWESAPKVPQRELALVLPSGTLLTMADGVVPLGVALEL